MNTFFMDQTSFCVLLISADNEWCEVVKVLRQYKVEEF